MSVVEEETTEPRTPLGDLPRLDGRGLAARTRLARGGGFGPVVEGLLADVPIEVGAAEVLDRGSGLARAGIVAQLVWPRLDARVGLGLETPLAHAVVDHLLGYAATAGTSLRQVTPVEWGILAFVAARALDRLDARTGPWGKWDLTIDRVGPDPFDARDLGSLTTVRWPARLGPVSGSIRAWFPTSLFARLDEPAPSPTLRAGLGGLMATWRGEAGSITLRSGPRTLRRGAVLPFDGPSLTGTPASPTGRLALACDDAERRSWFDATAVAGSAGSRLTILGPIRREPRPREPLPMIPTPPATPTGPEADPRAAATSLPVTLVVELGRVNLPLSRLASLAPGDVIELGRHSREPVELTSGGKLVARGELVQIDAELGVRILNLYL